MRGWSIINHHLQFMKYLLTRQGGTWHSAGQVFGSHWMWRRQPQYRHPCSQKPASHPPAGQAGYTAQQCDQGHHMLDPKYCRGTWPHLALASVRWRHRTTIMVCFSIHWHICMTHFVAIPILELHIPYEVLANSEHGHIVYSWKIRTLHRWHSTSESCHWSLRLPL